MTPKQSQVLDAIKALSKKGRRVDFASVAEFLGIVGASVSDSIGALCRDGHIDVIRMRGKRPEILLAGRHDPKPKKQVIRCLPKFPDGPKTRGIGTTERWIYGTYATPNYTGETVIDTVIEREVDSGPIPGREPLAVGRSSLDNVCLAIFFLLSAGPVHASPARDIHCIARAVYHEARGEPIEGQIAVAQVVLNRARSPDYPHNICDVVYQPLQFTDLHPDNPITDRAAWHTAVHVAAYAWAGELQDPTQGALYFFAPAKVSRPQWAAGKQEIRIAGHTFLREARNGD